MDISARFLMFALHGASWVLWLLVALSVMSLAVMMERFWYFKRHSCPRKAVLMADVRAVLADRADGGTLEMGVPPRDEELEAAIDGAKAREKLRFERHLAFLATLGSNAPFIGLFGTVLGIIKAFHDLAGGQAAGPSVVMAGISEALVATAVGLMVAIPAVVAFNYFNRRVKSRMAQVDWMAHLAVCELKSEWELESTYGRTEGVY
jgi:biopolymer transport protein ExbB